jgi:hypothetical protein
MIAQFFKSLQNLFKQPRLCSLVVSSKKDSSKIKENFNLSYMNDPVYNDFITEQEMPKSDFLPISTQGEEAGFSKLGSVSQQTKSLRQSINNMLLYLSSKSPRPIEKWASGKTLSLVPRAGLDINAYYDRKSLKFFYFGDPKLKKRVYTCDSRPVVLHEFGHAFLDILRPDLWSSQAIEVWALHEAFGDIIGLFGLLEYDELINFGIKETDGNLLKSNILSKMAAEMGRGIYNTTEGAYGESPECLRNLANNFIYVEPEKLPKEGREDQILNQHHSFSRVFSGAFYELLITIANIKVKSGKKQIVALKEARDVCAKYLIQGCMYAPGRARMFESLCKQILLVDKADGEPYQKIIKNVFEKRKLIKPVVKSLSTLKRDEIINSLSEPHEVLTFGPDFMVKISSSKTINLSSSLDDLKALEDNPLLSLEIEVPNDTVYYFEGDQLIESFEADEAEIIDSALNCLTILNKNSLVGNSEKSIFEIQDNKLVRKQFSCYCNLPNYCNPQAPEYGKPWKPKNNSGCSICYSKNCDPLPCDCGASNPPQPTINNCYITYKEGSNGTYTVVNSCMKRSC